MQPEFSSERNTLFNLKPDNYFMIDPTGRLRAAFFNGITGYLEDTLN